MRVAADMLVPTAGPFSVVTDKGVYFQEGNVTGSPSSVLFDAPLSLSSLRPGLPIDLDSFFASALEKEPDLRFQTIDELALWCQSSSFLAQVLPMSATLAAAVNRFYFELYCKRWAQPQLAAMLASVPTIMMWDDHDIFDGWGSHPPARQRSPVFQGIFAAARRW